MTIREYTEDAVRKYLRTVLFVDDQLFGSNCEDGARQEDDNLPDLSGVPDTSASSMASSDHVGQSEEAPRDPLDDSSPSAESFSPQEVVDGFSGLGIVCGLYQPKTSEFSDGAVPASLVDLCDHSDVFILDWKLKNHHADSPVPVLLEQLFKRDAILGEPRAIRFCAIYTDELLSTVFSKLHTEIFDNSSDDSKKEDLQKFQMRLNGLTIRLYRKINMSEADGSPTRFVPSSVLAETIVQDFAFEYDGIMSATALQGIAEVRNNAKRILDKFPPALDYALLVHGGLTVKAPTAPEDMQDLLSDEIHSIISNSPLSDHDLYELLWEKASGISPDIFRNVFPPKILKDPSVGPEVIKKYFCSLLKRDGVTEPNPFLGCDASTTDSHDVPSTAFLNRLLKLIVKADASHVYTEGDLSKLYCYRTIYGDNRALKFGTIVRKVGTDNRYVCLMPTCDCIRLEQEVAEFPFWELTPVDPSHRGHAHGAIITDERGRSRAVCVKGKIRKKMYFWKFRANNEVLFERVNGKYLLAEETDSEPKTTFEWVAELKPLHAQRMAEYVSRQFSRVGLAESEWLRLQVDR